MSLTETVDDDLKDISWAADGSWHANDPFGHRAAIMRAKSWLSQDHLAAVMRVRAVIRAMPAPIVFPCVECGKFAFPTLGVVCFWCRP